MTNSRLIFFAGLILAASAFAQRVEENDNRFMYNGAWTPTNDANASGGAYTVSGTVGSTVIFTITGTSFVIYRKMDTNGGYATMSVDGVPFGNVTFYCETTRYQIPAIIDELIPGDHVIQMTVSQFKPTGSGGTNVYLDATQNPVPAVYLPTQPQTDAVTRTNFYRSIMGLPPARHHLALGLAAVAHAQYLSDTNFVTTGGDPHIETFGASPDYTASSPALRDLYFGFTNGAGFEDSNNNPDPIEFVDGWMDGVYHRGPYLNYSLTDVGFGGFQFGSTMDFGAIVNKPLYPSAPLITTYPANNQTDVWVAYDGTDGPNSVTFFGSYGYPISLVVAYPANATPGTATVANTNGTLTDAAGNNVPVIISSSVMDSGVPGYLMVPNAPLNVSTTYTANMTGTDQLNNNFNQTWKFTTANANAVHGVNPALPPGSFMYIINWVMPGLTVPSQLEYGPTTAYGTIVPGTANGNGNAFQASLPGALATVGTTHYRVTSTDAQGNLYASPDHSIIVTNAIAPATIGNISTYQNPGQQTYQYETAGPVASTQVNYGLDTTYGSSAVGTLLPGYTTYFNANLLNLPSGTTYHFVITATDLKGNTFTTPDATFVAP